MSLDLESWTASGTRAPVTVGERSFDIFRRVAGAGPSMTLLHGFPTSSWDWAKIAPQLETAFRLLAFDFLGFGDSDKPRGHRYDLIEQADLVEAMWAAENVDETIVVAHDYGVSVTKELLARHAAGKLRTRVRGVVMLNGILYEELHRPVLIQRMLLNRVLGPIVTRLVREPQFASSFKAIFSAQHPLDDVECRQHWQSISKRGGARIYDRLIRYIADGRVHTARWTEALHAATVPCRFVWGMQDRVTGAPMIEKLRRHRPDADIIELADVGHYPQLEAPIEVARAVLDHAARI